MMYTNFLKVNGLKSVEVTRMQVTEGRVNPAYKLQVFFFFLLYMVLFFFFLPLLSGFSFLQALGLERYWP